MKYKEEFKDVVKFAKQENLFLGYGNPNGKILMIGKEHYFNHKNEIDTNAFYDEIISCRENDIDKNTNSWLKNIEENFKYDWNVNLKDGLDDSNPLNAWWNQKNKQNKNNNGGTSNTYLHYQKIYQNIFLDGLKEENINFQKEFFLSELNDLPSKKSFNLKKLNDLRSRFINKRKALFEKEFFESFPVTIIAAGHYPEKHDFDIEKIFKVNWIGETTKVDKSWYNLHYSDDKKRLLIHTRQLSTSVSNKLIESLSDTIKKFIAKDTHKSIL